MADYHPLITHAVAGLDQNTSENRRTLYERARAALLNQLRSVNPPLEESEITRERLALEEAIRKVEAEAEAAKHAPAPAGQPAAEAAPAARPAPSAEKSGSVTDQGLRGFRETMAEAEGLGGAAEAHRVAQDFYENVPSEQAAPEPASPAGARVPPPATHYFEPHTGEEPAPAGESETLYEALPRGGRARAHEPPEGAVPPPPYDEHEEVYGRPPRAWGRIIAVFAVVLAIAGLAGVGYWQRHNISALMASFRTAPVKTAKKQAPTPGRSKITDRVQQSNGRSKTATAPAAAVAQRVVLYEEDKSNPKGKRYVGSAIWRTETVSPGSGLAPELAVRADVDIPERHMRMTLSLRRNTDKALPASHTIEIQFTLPSNFPEGGIGNVPGVLMKASEQERGVPLAGLSVKVTDGYFLIGLSAVQVDKERNIEMLKNRDWFDIPIVYTSGKRAILALEKGTPGQRAFAEAFRAWGE